MKKVLILAEGPTEEAFVKHILREHLLKCDVMLIPKIVTTRRVKNGPNFKGGIVSYPKVRREVIRLLGDTSATRVTTIFDFYGLPDDFPGRRTATGNACQKVRFVENAFEKDVNDHRFSAYLSLHEFESLLFSSPYEIAKTLNAAEKESELRAIRNSFASPEEINDNPKTAPSKRLIFPNTIRSFSGGLSLKISAFRRSDQNARILTNG
ncbi:MAG: hypothetical protein DRI57_03930 [Deltaproteobacteria bacterium]|nr:MAG: hypothetical protein DRI57_03930 [Deltaproteobacteria bacterium]